MSVRRRFSLIILLLLLPISGLAIWHAWTQSPLPFLMATPRAGELPKGKFANEEHWLADETTRDIAEMLAFAKDPAATVDFKATPQAANRYDLEAKIGGATVVKSLSLQESIWSPSDYAAWAEQIVTGAGLQAPAASETPLAWIQSMTQPTPPGLIREGQRLSKALTAAPLDASLHEQAALLTLSFALREAAGNFTDDRRELCRATAHLSIARALAPQARGPLRDLAEAALATLAERHGPAMAMLQKLDGNPSLAPWVNALRMRNTGDWRNQQTALTLLEQLEIFRARSLNIGTDFGLSWLRTQKGAPLVRDWQRIVLETNFGVETGHSFAKECIPQAIILVRNDWQTYFGSAMPGANFIKILNEPAARCVGKGSDGKSELRVLSWDFWAAQHQRQFCQCIRATNTFLRDDWGVPEYKNVQKFVKANYAGLTLFPLLERELSNSGADFEDLRTRVTQLVTGHPELVNAAAWANLNKSPDAASPSLRLPDPAHWVAHYCPFGTAYEFGARCYHYCVPEDNEPEKWKALLALAPYQYDVLYSYVWKKYRDNPPIEAAEAEMAPITPYNLQALTYLSNIEFLGSPKYPETIERMCQFDPGNYITLGNYFVMHSNPERAAEAFKKAAALWVNRVGVANSCGWYVNYLDDHGRKAEALTLAQEAAEVYSYAGLETMARLMEKRGRLKDAEDYFKKIAERYGDKSQVQSFYIRQASDPMFASVGGPLRAKVYPQGMEKVALADLKAPPTDGVRMVNTTTFAKSAGLARGDIFVGFDGIRVHNMAQFGDARVRTADPRVTYLVWNNAHGYHEVKTVIPARRLGVEIDNWVGK